MTFRVEISSEPLLVFSTTAVQSPLGETEVASILGVGIGVDVSVGEDVGVLLGIGEGALVVVGSDVEVETAVG